MNQGINFLSDFKDFYIPRDVIDSYSNFFEELEKNDFMMCSWMLQTFWEDTRNPIFRLAFLKKCFDHCINLFQNNPKPNEIPYRYFNSLLSIFLLIISFDFDSKAIPYTNPPKLSIKDDIYTVGKALIHNESLNRHIQSWFSLSTIHLDSLFSQLFDSIQLRFKTFDMSNSNFYEKPIKSILEQTNVPIIDYSLPIFTLYNMFSFLHRNPTEIDTFVKAIKNLLESPLDPIQLRILIHIIYLEMIFFPGTIKSEIADALNPCLCQCGDVSIACASIGSSIQKEKHYPGFTYYHHLDLLTKNNVSFNGNTPTFLSSSSSRFVESFLYNSYPESSVISLPMNVISFTRFYLKAKFQCERDFSVQELIDFSSQLKFSTESSIELAKKFNIKYKEHKKSTPEEGEQKKKSDSKHHSKKKIDLHTVEFPTHPFIKYQTQKLSLDFEINSATSVKYDETMKIYTTTASFIFQKSLFNPIQNYVKTVETSQLQNYHILLIGDDFLIGNALLSYVTAANRMKDCLSRVSLIFHIVPTDDSRSNQIADFISSFDPIYRYFVRHLFPIMCSISPVINENSQVQDVPLDLDVSSSEKDRYGNTIWFGNPSPFNMFNFGIQQYLQFSVHSVDVMVWKCVIQYMPDKDNSEGEKRVVLVPFVSSVQIGTAFSRTSQSLIPTQNQQQSQQNSNLSQQSSSSASNTMQTEAPPSQTDFDSENSEENIFVPSSLECDKDTVGTQGILLVRDESKIKTKANYQDVDIDNYQTVLPTLSNDAEANQEDELQSSYNDLSNSTSGGQAKDPKLDEQLRKRTRRKTDSAYHPPIHTDAAIVNQKRESMNIKKRRSRKNSLNPPSSSGTFEDLSIDDLDQFILKTTNCSNQSRTDVMKINSIAFWNANADLSVNPSDGWLMMEYTLDNKIRFNNQSSRIDNADKLYQELIVEASIECLYNEDSFNATIDQSVYGPLAKISISPLKCDYEKDNRLRMKFASFTPFM